MNSIPVQPRPAFVLGPIQTLWLERLRQNPERQAKGTLGQTTFQDERPYVACCLGELLICKKLLEGKDIFTLFLSDIGSPIIKTLRDTERDLSASGTLKFSFKELELHNDIGGAFKGEHGTEYVVFDSDGNENPNGFFTSLAGLNDGGVSWAKIADIVQQNPHYFFI